MVLLVYAIARRLAGTHAALFAAFVLMTTNHFDRVAREATTDTLLCLSIYIAIYAWLRLRKSEPAWFYVLCAAVGAGAMIKGPAVLVAPLAIAADWLLRRDPEKSLIPRHYWAGGLLALAIVAPWHIWMTAEYGKAFLSQYVGFQLLARATRVLQDSGGGWAYYLRVIFHGAFPWSIVAVFALFKWIWKKEWKFSLLWILAGILLIGYTIVQTKHRWYIIPIYPALAVEVGRLLADASAKRRIVRYAAVALLSLGMGIAFAKLVKRQGDPFTNDVAQLATMAGASAHAKPLLLITTPGPDPRLDVPTAVFYSNRHGLLFNVPADANTIAGLLKRRNFADAIVQNDALPDVSRLFIVHPIAQNSTAAYVEIQPKRSVTP